jgi:hypothetical protein
MRYGLLLASLVAALIATTSALAGNGNGVTPDKQALPPLGEPVTTLVSGPTPIAPGDVPRGGVGSLGSVGAVKGTAAMTAGSFVACWAGTARNGSSDWSGHIYIYQHLYWCGNGAAITYATASQSYDQVGWYTLTNAFGPWWSGGCVGCANLRVSGYILWNWKASLINVSHSGTTHLDTTLWASGGVTF